jgi:gas vesicle protein
LFLHESEAYAEYTEIGLSQRLSSDSKAVLTVEEHMDKNGLSSFLMGLGVGVAIGMLFAPKSGQETRDMITKKAGEGSDYLKQRSDDLRKNASEWVDKGKEALRSQKESLSDAMEAGRQAYRDAVSGQSTGSEV